jgi:hypothetical protein
MAGKLEPCGSWQVAHSPDLKGSCTTFFFAAHLLGHALVAARAEGVPCREGQLGAVGGVRIVAGDALPLLEGRVLELVPAGELGRLVAARAERAARGADGEGLERLLVGVAVAAAAPGDDLVHRALEQLGLVRRVRVVADGARLQHDRVLAVRLLEAPRLGGVALGAELPLVGQQEGLLIGRMGGVASDAPVLGHDRVDDLPLERLALVAAVAGLGALGLQHVRRVRAVGVVALDAGAALQDRVDDLLVQADRLAIVAAQAELVPGLLQHQRRDDAVPQVAVLALPLLDRGVEHLRAVVLLGELLVALHAVLLLEAPLRRRRRRREHGGERERAAQHRPRPDGPGHGHDPRSDGTVSCRSG